MDFKYVPWAQHNLARAPQSVRADYFSTQRIDRQQDPKKPAPQTKPMTAYNNYFENTYKLSSYGCHYQQAEHLIISARSFQNPEQLGSSGALLQYNNNSKVNKVEAPKSTSWKKVKKDVMGVPFTASACCSSMKYLQTSKSNKQSPEDRALPIRKCTEGNVQTFDNIGVVVPISNPSSSKFTKKTVQFEQSVNSKKVSYRGKNASCNKPKKIVLIPTVAAKPQASSTNKNQKIPKVGTLSQERSLTHLSSKKQSQKLSQTKDMKNINKKIPKKSSKPQMRNTEIPSWMLKKSLVGANRCTSQKGEDTAAPGYINSVTCTLDNKLEQYSQMQNDCLSLSHPMSHALPMSRKNSLKSIVSNQGKEESAVKKAKPKKFMYLMNRIKEPNKYNNSKQYNNIQAEKCGTQKEISRKNSPNLKLEAESNIKPDSLQKKKSSDNVRSNKTLDNKNTNNNNKLISIQNTKVVLQKKPSTNIKKPRPTVNHDHSRTKKPRETICTGILANESPSRLILKEPSRRISTLVQQVLLSSSRPATRQQNQQSMANLHTAVSEHIRTFETQKAIALSTSGDLIEAQQELLATKPPLLLDSYRLAHQTHERNKDSRHQQVIRLAIQEDNMCRPKPQTKLFAEQPQITPKIRAILVDWLMRICSELFLSRQAFHLSLCFMDSYTLKTPGIKKQEYQLIGLACLLIAYKQQVMASSYTHFLEKLTQSCDYGYSQDQILDRQEKIVFALQFKLNNLTLGFWVEYFSSRWDRYLQKVDYLNLSGVRDCAKIDSWPCIYKRMTSREIETDSHSKQNVILQGSRMFQELVFFVDCASMLYTEASELFSKSRLVAAFLYLVLRIELERTINLAQEKCVNDNSGICHDSGFEARYKAMHQQFKQKASPMLRDRTGFNEVYNNYLVGLTDFELADIIAEVKYAVSFMQCYPTSDQHWKWNKFCKAEILPQSHFECMLGYVLHRLQKPNS